MDKNRPRRATHLLFFLFSPQGHEKVSLYGTRVTLFAEAITRCSADSCWGRSSDDGVGRRSWKKTRRTGGLQICRGRELMEQVHFLDDYLPGSSVSRRPFPHFCFFYLCGKVSTCFCYLLRLKTASRICQMFKRTRIMQTFCSIHVSDS